MNLFLILVLLAQSSAAAPSPERIIVRPVLRDTLRKDFWHLARTPLRRPKVGLVLSGGGARGIAQVGVLKVLEANNIPVDFIAATSIGSIVGGLYASGWTPAEIESLALVTDWDEILSLTGDARRADLFPDEKVAMDRSFLLLRFQGLQPVLPTTVSSGQRLTSLLNTLTLQSLYHPERSFDDLKIPFRAITTDLVSGRRVVLSHGSLAEALRASATVPILFSPIERDGMQLVDGGLVSNIPVDVARSAGCDLVIVVKTTSSLRGADQMDAPWETADQVMGIMMEQSNREQLADADVVIVPDLGQHLASDFQGLDSLMEWGRSAAAASAGQIRMAYDRLKYLMAGIEGSEPNRIFRNTTVTRVGEGIPDTVWKHITDEARSGVVSLREIKDHVDIVYAVGSFQDVVAEVLVDSSQTRVTYTVVQNPVVAAVRCEGCSRVPWADLENRFAPILGKPINGETGRAVMESVLRLYRGRGYALARIDSLTFDPQRGELQVRIDEGVIQQITIEGGVRTKDWYVLREFPLREGDVFELDEANRGITNINGSSLFEYVYLEVDYVQRGPQLTIRLKERPSQLVRLGIRADNERQLQGSVDIRDENFQGTGMVLGIAAAGGTRNVDAILEYKVRRLFDSYFTVGVSGFYRKLDSYLYEDAPPPGQNQWERKRVGEYRDQRYGGSVTVGRQLERLGNATVEFVLQNVRTISLENATQLESSNRLRMIRIGTSIDAKDSYPFPTSGVGLNLSYEFALEMLGGDVSYNALRVMYENYHALGSRFSFHPKFTLGFADKSMPFSQEFRLGGRDLFFGLREDDRRGRQLILMNLEMRYLLPFRIVFDSYLRARYDLATISEIPEEIKFTNLRHGIGIELAVDTPIGPAIFSLGKSFYLSKDLPDNPIQQGPLLFYVAIGYQL